MDTFVINGGRRLSGTVQINGSKNASLPLMAASLLTDEPVALRDVPYLKDISNMAGLLGELGCAVSHEGGRVEARVEDLTPITARYDVVRTMRASICVLGPLLARRGRATISMPGGCAIGDRPIDLHLRGLEALGARLHMDGGNITVSADRLRGNTVFLGGPFGSTVLGTANIMSAATLAKGRTVIESAACEPEIVNLAQMLNQMGAQIRGAGSPRLIIDGVESLGGCDLRVMPDRIEAGTYVIASAITHGDLTIENCPLDALLAFADRLGEVGIGIEPTEANYDPNRCTVRIVTPELLHPTQVTTQPHPGFPTDLQAQMMALLCLAEGNSVITERIYEQRFLHVAELGRMGARLYRQGPTVVVNGGAALAGAPVMASDLRASACLVLAGLAARGQTVINRVYHLDRGYERMEERLSAVGASIERIDDSELPGEVIVPAGSARF